MAAHPWNPEKELKVDQPHRIKIFSPRTWNPEKELKAVSAVTSRKTSILLVESGEGIERDIPGCAEAPAATVESGEGIESRRRDASTRSSPSWNPEKELKEMLRHASPPRSQPVESGEGIESRHSDGVHVSEAGVESGEGIESFECAPDRGLPHYVVESDEGIERVPDSIYLTDAIGPVESGEGIERDFLEAPPCPELASGIR